MAQANFFTPGYGDQVQQQGIDRQRKMADLLLNQSQQPLRGDMVGQVYVAPSITQHLAQLLRGYQSNQLQKEADTRQIDLAKSMQDRNQSDTSSFMQAMQGTPGQPEIPSQPEIKGNNPSAYVAPQEGKAAIPGMPGDKIKALAIALGSQNPMLQSIGSKMFENQFDSKPVVVGRSLMTPQGQIVGTDSTWAQEQQAARAQKMEELKQKAEDQRSSQQERLQAQEAMVRLAASLRPAPQPQAPVSVIGPDGKPVYVPPSQAYGMVPANSTEKPLTEFQGKSASYGTRAQQAHDQLNELEGKYNPSAVKINNVGGVLTNWAAPANVQKVTQAQRNFVNAVLRQESGAAIGKSEFDNAAQQYFPQPGDTPEVIKQKKQNRETAISGFERAAGPGAADIKAMREQNSYLSQSNNNQDSQALDWAKSNPNDPRSKLILQRLGAK